MRGSDPIRVLLAAPTFGAYGGIEAFVLTLAAALATDRRLDVRVCFKPAARFHLASSLAAASENVPVRFCNRGSADLWAAIAWADVVHGQNASPDIALIASLLGKPLTLSLHNVLPAAPRMRRLSWRLAARLARSRWYNSRFVWSTWEPRRRRTGSAHVPPALRASVRQVPPADRRGFLFLGRLVPGKGADILIDAYHASGVDPSEWPLTIAGEGPMRDALEARCRAEKRGGIRFAGFLHGTAKTSQLAAAKWLVVPSHWREPFGLVATEARQAGIPCIATGDGGLPEAAGRDALICPHADRDALAALLRAAAAMPEDEYTARSRRTQRDLADEAIGPDFYAEAYLQLTREA